MTAANNKKVLIVGAGFAGLSSAFWMTELGYDVTVMEVGPGIKVGGTAVNIRGNTIDIVKRMGLFEKIRDNRLSLRLWEFKNADDVTERQLVIRAEDEMPGDDDYEIARDVLLNLLFDAVKHRCDIQFGQTITGITSATEADRVDVALANGTIQSYDLVLGCDGIHSRVRRLCFGDEAQFLHSLQRYFSITIVDKLLIARDTAQMFNEPGRAVMLNAYEDRTDIILAFASDIDIAYDYRDEARQRAIIADRFRGMGWRTAELLTEVASAPTFYFDKLCQVRMPAWSSGRVVLVGDAAYCPSPAAGMGGSLAIDGAAALADAMRAAAGDYALAFRHYDENLRPFIDAVQADAVRFGCEMMVPMTAEAIRARNAKTGNDF